jgi:hypothetical protein
MAQNSKKGRFRLEAGLGRITDKPRPDKAEKRMKTGRRAPKRSRGILE